MGLYSSLFSLLLAFLYLETGFLSFLMVLLTLFVSFSIALTFYSRSSGLSEFLFFLLLVTVLIFFRTTSL